MTPERSTFEYQLYHAYVATQTHGKATVLLYYLAKLREDLKTNMRLVEVRLCKTLSVFCIMGC